MIIKNQSSLYSSRQ